MGMRKAPPEILEVSSRPFHCTGCVTSKSKPHASRWWEVWVVPSYTLRARVPECIFLHLHKKKHKLTGAENAIIAEMYRQGIIGPPKDD